MPLVLPRQLPRQFRVGIDAPAAAAAAAGQGGALRRPRQLPHQLVGVPVAVDEEGLDGVFHVPALVPQDGVEVLGRVPLIGEHGLEGGQGLLSIM